MSADPSPKVEWHGRPAALLAACIGMALLMALARLTLDHAPLYDELLHVLAARGINETGDPVIADGFYGRGELYTRAVALAFRVLDDTLPTARLPALLSSLALVALTAIWLTGRAGFTAGTTAALVLAGSAISVEMAVFARFYSMHALAILVALCAIFESLRTDRSRRSRLIALVVAAAALAIAFTLQITTLLATAALDRFARCEPETPGALAGGDIRRHRARRRGHRAPGSRGAAA
jgi:4-amino-4-deoxy-L-arabinose transferase-like glycosyltransferase